MKCINISTANLTSKFNLNRNLDICYSWFHITFLKYCVLRSELRCQVQKFILKFTSRFVNKASDWSLNKNKCILYKPVCEYGYYSQWEFSLTIPYNFNIYAWMISWSSIYTTWLSDSIKVAQNRYFWAFAICLVLRQKHNCQPRPRPFTRLPLLGLVDFRPAFGNYGVTCEMKAVYTSYYNPKLTKPHVKASWVKGSRQGRVHKNIDIKCALLFFLNRNVVSTKWGDLKANWLAPCRLLRHENKVWKMCFISRLQIEKNCKGDKHFKKFIPVGSLRITIVLSGRIYTEIVV
jgi:hypothetical protein